MKILNKLELMSPSIKVGGSNGYSVELPKNAGALLTEESTNSLISTAKTEAISESKNYTDQKVFSVYRVKGSVPSVEDLPENAEVGDVYNISDDLGGHNYVKTEDGWDKLGGTVDLSPYALKTDVSGCVEALEDKITAAQNSAVSTSNAYTDACIVAANLSQYAKAEDVYTKTAADSTFVKIGDATTGDVDADTVEAEILNVSGCLVVSGNSTFSGWATFSQVPTVNGDYLATVCSTEGYINERLCNYLPVTPTDSLVVAYCVSNDVDFLGEVNIDGRAVATESFVRGSISCAIDAVEAKIPTDYLPANGPINLCNGGTGYFVEQEVDFGSGANFWGNFSICSNANATYGGSRIATVVDIPTDYLPATKIADGRYDASSVILDLFYLNVNSGANLPESTTVNGENVATKLYVNTIRSCTLTSAQIYTDEKISALGSVLEYKGNKTYEELPTEGNEVGDVYNITADYTEKGIKAGDNVVWNGSDWDVLSAPIDLSGYYDKEEVDDKLEGYLPVESGCNDAYSYDSVNKALRFYNNGIEVMRLCGAGHVVFPTPPVDNNGSEFTTKSYVDAQVKIATDAINALSGCVYTKDEVEDALEGYLPATATAEVNCTGFKYTVDGRLFVGKEGESKVTSISYQHFCTYDIQTCTVYLVSEPTLDRHATPKSYVDNLVSTSISTANSNIVYDEDFVLGDGTFDASTSQMKWTVSPEGATKILSVIALDGEGNLVHPSYKWANNTLTVSIFAESEQDNPGYTVTVSYKK